MMTNELADEQFLAQYDSREYEKPSVAVDLLIFTIEDDELKILLVERKASPFVGRLSLPGVFVGIHESLEDAVKRGLLDKAGLENIYFEQLYTWGEVDRDPRMRIISVSYLALVPKEELYTCDQLGDIRRHLFSVKDILNEEKDDAIAFDHKKMIHYGRERIKNKVAYTSIAFQFLPEKFTLPDLQKIYEILLDKKLYKANFRKKIKELVSETDEYTTGQMHRPSKIYTRSPQKIEN